MRNTRHNITHSQCHTKFAEHLFRECSEIREERGEEKGKVRKKGGRGEREEGGEGGRGRRD